MHRASIFALKCLVNIWISQNRFYQMICRSYLAILLCLQHSFHWRKSVNTCVNVKMQSYETSFRWPCISQIMRNQSIIKIPLFAVEFLCIRNFGVWQLILVKCRVHCPPSLYLIHEMSHRLANLAGNRILNDIFFLCVSSSPRPPFPIDQMNVVAIRKKDDTSKCDRQIVQQRKLPNGEQ